MLCSSNVQNKRGVYILGLIGFGGQKCARCAKWKFGVHTWSTRVLGQKVVFFVHFCVFGVQFPKQWPYVPILGSKMVIFMILAHF